MATLKVIAGEFVGQEFRLAEGANQVGRTAAADIQLDTKKTSRQHVSILHKGEAEWVVRDDKSSNGTFLNGIRLPANKEVPLVGGDEIRVGDVHLRFFLSDLSLAEISIPHHQIHEILSENKVTTVYRAFHEPIARDVNLEILRPEHLQDKQHIGRFVQETRAGGKLSHQHLLQINDFGKTESGTYYFTRELFGESLLRYMRSSKEPPVMEMVLKASVQIADALEYGHSRGILHRSIMPKHILLDKSGEAKLAGLGIPRSFDSKPLCATAPYYLSPEALGGRPIDGRSDLYSFGAVLYHFLSRYPVCQDDPDTVTATVLSAVPNEPLQDVAPHVPTEICEIINRLIMKDPAARYSTAAEVRDALAGACERLRTEEMAQPPVRQKAETLASAAKTAMDSGETNVEDEEPKPLAWLPWAIGGAVAGVLLLTVIAFVFLGDGEPTETPGTETTGTEEGEGETEAIDLAKLFAPIEIMEEESRYEEARKAFEDLLSEYSDNQRVLDAVTIRLDDLEEKEAAHTHLLAAKEALEEYKDQYRKTPDDYMGLKAALAELAKKYPELKDDILDENAMLAGIPPRLVNVARRKVQELATRSDYDGAYTYAQEFRDDNPDLPGMVQLNQTVKEIQEKEAAKVAALEKEVDGLLAKQLFNAALDACAKATEGVSSKVIAAASGKARAKVTAQLDGVYGKCFAEAKPHLLAFRFEKAREACLSIRSKLKGTPAEEDLKGLEAQIDQVEKLFSKVIDIIKDKKPTEPPASVQELDAVKALSKGGRKPLITGATKTNVRISIGPAGATLSWEDLAGQPAADIFKLFIPAKVEAAAKALKAYEALLE